MMHSKQPLSYYQPNPNHVPVAGEEYIHLQQDWGIEGEKLRVAIPTHKINSAIKNYFGRSIKGDPTAWLYKQSTSDFDLFICHVYRSYGVVDFDGFQKPS